MTTAQEPLRIGHDGEAAAQTLNVAWFGDPPSWLREADALSDIVVSRSDTGTAPEVSRADVVHLAPGALRAVRAVRAAAPLSRIVGDVRGAKEIEAVATDFASLDAILVGSAWEQERIARVSQGPARMILVDPAPLDLEWYATRQTLLDSRGLGIKRFLRFHRIAAPTVLFVGPFTARGGLDLVIGSAYRLRERFENLRLAAIPFGSTDRRYLDRCERLALGLGHRGIIEWAPIAEETRYWYASASVVCCPWGVVGPDTPRLLSAAAGRPIVVSASSGLATGDEDEGLMVVPTATEDALVTMLDEALSDLDRADELGAARRRRLEDETAPAALARRHASLWHTVAGRRESSSPTPPA